MVWDEGEGWSGLLWALDDGDLQHKKTPICTDARAPRALMFLEYYSSVAIQPTCTDN